MDILMPTALDRLPRTPFVTIYCTALQLELSTVSLVLLYLGLWRQDLCLIYFS